jgi:6-phosphogluconolactonase (cycloisomerase 2 family)
LSADAADGAATALVAMTFHGEESSELRLFAPAGEGQLRLLDAFRISPSSDGLLFHPSGRFLYVSAYPSRSLYAFSISADGRLEMIQQIEEAEGRLAWSSPAR